MSNQYPHTEITEGNNNIKRALELKKKEKYLNTTSNINHIT